MEIVERLTELDPVRTYPQRGATLIAGLVGAHSFRLDRPDADALSSESALTTTDPTISLPLRQGRTLIGTLHLEIVGDAPAGNQLELLKWASRLYGRGLDYAERLTDEGSRRPGEAVEETLRRAPLTPRERDVVALLVAGVEHPRDRRRDRADGVDRQHLPQTHLFQARRALEGRADCPDGRDSYHSPARPL